MVLAPEAILYHKQEVIVIEANRYPNPTCVIVVTTVSRLHLLVIDLVYGKIQQRLTPSKLKYLQIWQQLNHMYKYGSKLVNRGIEKCCQYADIFNKLLLIYHLFHLHKYDLIDLKK